MANGTADTNRLWNETDARAHGDMLRARWLLHHVVGRYRPFLSWATAGIFSASGMQKTGDEAIALTILGVIGIAVAVVSLAQRRDRFKWIVFVVGLLSLGFSIYYYVALRDNLSGIGDEFFSASLGAGIYVCLVAGILVLIGAIMTAANRRGRRVSPSAP